ncbi:hypothetical protein [Tabrizicola sp.]|uniref:hypothetical protein n=1 Tax=Tabrizicola sp. TaxID=2005166 RepID=UPI00286A97B9|nr:hypothetical protein [Tabrizicola sp.]
MLADRAGIPDDRGGVADPWRLADGWPSHGDCGAARSSGPMAWVGAALAIAGTALISLAA